MLDTHCAPCALEGDERFAVDYWQGRPVCGPCLVEATMTPDPVRMVADVRAEAPAKIHKPQVAKHAFSRSARRARREDGVDTRVRVTRTR